MKWRLLLTGAGQGAWNMAVDETLMRSVDEGESPPTMRFYGWLPECVSIGRYQPASDLAEAARSDCGVSWVRRPTGGRAVYHDESEVTYSVCASRSSSEIGGTVLESYRKIAAALVEGLRLLGLDVSLAPPADHRGIRSNPSCFDTPSDHEIMWRGRKLIGSAQTRSRAAILQHGSVRVAGSAAYLIHNLALDGENLQTARRTSEEHATSLAEALGHVPSRSEVVLALRTGFERCWNVELVEGELSSVEEVRSHALAAARYRSTEWCHKF